MGGEVDGVEEKGAAGISVAGDGAGSGAGVDLRGVDGAFDFAGAVGVVGEEVDVNVEGDEEGFVFGGEDVFEELGSGLLLEGEDVDLAAAGVEEDADGEGEIFFLGKVLGLLEDLVLEDAAVVFVEVGDEAALVADGEVDVDEVDVDFEGLGVADVDGLGLGLAGGGRTAGGGGLLRVEDGGESERKEGSGKAEGAHTPLDDEVGAEFAEKCGCMGRNIGGGGSVQRVGTDGAGLRRRDGGGRWCAGNLLGLGWLWESGWKYGRALVVSKSVLAGALACMVLGLTAQERGRAQQPQIPDGPKPQQQAIPDAPKPQAIPVGPVTPGKGSTDSTSEPATVTGDSSTSNDAGVPRKLPETPAQKTDEGQQPELPGAGEGPKAFTLVVQTNFVEIPFTVKDNKGRRCPGSTWRDVRVYENNLRQQLAVFTTDAVPAVGGAGDRPEPGLRQYGEGEQLAGGAAGGVYAV